MLQCTDSGFFSAGHLHFFQGRISNVDVEDRFLDSRLPK